MLPRQPKLRESILSGALSAGLLLALVLLILSRREGVTISATAVCSYGQELAVEYHLKQDLGRGQPKTWVLTVTNTVHTEIIAQAQARTPGSRPAYSNPTSTKVPRSADDVTLRVKVNRGRLTAPPSLMSGIELEHTGTNEVFVQLGDMRPDQEKVVLIDVSAGG